MSLVEMEPLVVKRSTEAERLGVLKQAEVAESVSHRQTDQGQEGGESRRIIARWQTMQDDKMVGVGDLSWSNRDNFNSTAALEAMLVSSVLKRNMTTQVLIISATPSLIE
ncbi:hypothetical protein pipiens_014966 [Culex pipiens pipiens]|uniref:Uncharacterized protein n=1 Tax=Culex pipiens pipiens TaxID=38569 RepID=A0ABD1CSL0_CULPP|nr:uncharacterized protein LOC120427375 [Culex pipiens pallens]